MEKKSLQQCKVPTKKGFSLANIIEERMGKVKVEILDKAKKVVKVDWFENKEIKRLWI